MLSRVRIACLVAASFALAGCLDALDVPHYRDARPSVADAIAPLDVQMVSDTGQGIDVQADAADDRSDVPLDVAAEVGVDAAADAHRDVSTDTIGPDTIAVDASDVASADAAHDVPDSGATCSPVTFTCPVLMSPTCATMTSLQTYLVSAVASTPCCTDADCVLVSTDRCCGDNAAARVGPIADCLQSVELSIDTLCPVVVCPAVVCLLHHPVCQAGVCAVAAGSVL